MLQDEGRENHVKVLIGKQLQMVCCVHEEFALGDRGVQFPGFGNHAVGDVHAANMLKMVCQRAG